MKTLYVRDNGVPVLEEEVRTELCARTHAIYMPGVPIPGHYCRFTHSGKTPLTGKVVCHTCGRESNND